MALHSTTFQYLASKSLMSDEDQSIDASSSESEAQFVHSEAVEASDSSDSEGSSQSSVDVDSDGISDGEDEIDNFDDDLPEIETVPRPMVLAFVLNTLSRLQYECDYDSETLANYFVDLCHLYVSTRPFHAYLKPHLQLEIPQTSLSHTHTHT